jgi:hypothetical protein
MKASEVSMLPIMMSNGTVAYQVPNGTPVAFVYNGNLRSGLVECGDHPITLTIETDHGYRQYSRKLIQDMSLRG